MEARHDGTLREPYAFRSAVLKLFAFSEVRRRKPNISELVYKYLNLDDGKQDGEKASENYGGKCSFCKRQKRRGEVLDSLDSRNIKNMANKRKDSSRNSKLRRVKRRPTTRDQTLSSCMHKSNVGEG